ncbi:MAG: helicase-related protein, partial [Planctomycetota bacterium]|nr:helicase-related protein [Planctomycetota bacterium]
SYIVLPRVGEDGNGGGGEFREGTLWPEIRTAAAEAERLSKEVFPDLRIGLLHGRMSGEEKEKAIADMRAGKIQVLVSTIVVEVGVDLPNATVMMIENAERFGLSTLHQLRGRIGRSGLKSWCFLMARAETEDARERLRIMCETRDGFRIAEEDFRLRGPGEFFGTSQHGMPELKVADIFRDEVLLMQAREDAQRVIEDDPDLSKPSNAALRARVEKVFSGRLGLVDVG